MDTLAFNMINKLKRGGGVGYEQTIARVELLPPTTVDAQYQEEAGIAIGILPDMQLEIGDTLRVVFDDIPYYTEHKEEAVADNDEIVGFGNTGMFGGTDTGEPFLIVPNAEGGVAMMVCEAGTHTVSVTLETKVIHTINPKFLPKAGVSNLYDLSALFGTIFPETFNVPSMIFVVSLGELEEAVKAFENGELIGVSCKLNSKVLNHLASVITITKGGYETVVSFPIVYNGTTDVEVSFSLLWTEGKGKIVLRKTA